jgi:hypothetical protein
MESFNKETIEQAMAVYKPISEGLLLMVKEGTSSEDYQQKAEAALEVLYLKYTPPPEEVEGPESTGD